MSRRKVVIPMFSLTSDVLTSIQGKLGTNSKVLRIYSFVVCHLEFIYVKNKQLLWSYLVNFFFLPRTLSRRS